MKTKHKLIGRNAGTRLAASQERVAELVGCDKSYISLVFDGRRTPLLDTAVKIAKAIGTDIDTLHNSLCGRAQLAKVARPKARVGQGRRSKSLLIQEIGKGQDYIAARASISETYLAAILAGRKVPRLDIAGRVAAACGVSIDRIVKLAPAPKNGRQTL